MDSAPPGCLLVLVQLSASMTAEVVTPLGESTAAAAAGYGLDHLLEGLVSVAAEPLPVALDIAVIGYRASDNGVSFESLLPAGGGSFISLEQLAAAEVASRSEGHPRRWTLLSDPAGQPAPTAALGYVHRLLVRWLGTRYHARPPIVVHWTDGADIDDRYTTALRAVTALTTALGSVQVFHAVLSPNPPPAFLSPCSVNDFPTGALWDMVFGEPSPSPVVELGGPPLVTLQSFWTQKLGNEPHYWEDAFVVGPCGTVAAIADGASEGIFSRQWAKLLANRAVADRPALTSPAAFAAWIATCRDEFATAIDYPNLRWSQQKKVDEVGAAATLLLLEIGRPNDDGLRPWRAAAIGDACLHWLYGEGGSGSFPVVDDGQLGSAPDLIRSKLGTRVPPVLVAAGTCGPGDLFLLATDAMAGRLLRERNWKRYCTLDEDSWRKELDHLRASGQVVNDDCTLVILKLESVPAEVVELAEESDEVELQSE